MTDAWATMKWIKALRIPNICGKHWSNTKTKQGKKYSNFTGVRERGREGENLWERKKELEVPPLRVAKHMKKHNNSSSNRVM